MVLKDKKIAIIGAGPGGLTLANLLHKEGMEVQVYERDLDQYARVQGSPLDLHEESGLKALQKAGLIDEFKANYLPGADKMQILNAQAQVFYTDHAKKTIDNFGDPNFRPEIDRGVLRKILLEALPSNLVVWNSHFITMEPQGDGWQLHFNDGTTTYADLVVAADGARSKIRSYLTDSKAEYSGITMLEGTIYDAKTKAPRIDKLLKGGKIMAFGDNKNILMGQKANNEIGFYASLRLDENWFAITNLDYRSNTQMLAWFRQQYPEWDAIWEELFESADSFIPRPIYCVPVNQKWQTKANITLLGDAAHVMPPFAGEGVNMAMQDALELSECLTSAAFHSLQDAIAGYETKMLQRTASIAQESLDNGEKMHAVDALDNMLHFFNSH